MFSPSRRLFLGPPSPASPRTRCPAISRRSDPNPQSVPEDAPFQPATLFLTWHTDPTTTMTVQWVGAAGETADTNIYYATGHVGASPPVRD